MSGNFDFLAEEFPALATFGNQAESYCKSDPNSSLIKIGMLGETLVSLIYELTGTDAPYDGKAVSRINKLQQDGYLPSQVASVLHVMRKDRNRAVHDGYASSERATALIPIVYNLCQWFAMAFGAKQYKRLSYVVPAPANKPVVKTTSASEDEKLVAEALQSASKVPKIPKSDRVKRVFRAENQRPKTEAETRLLIDDALRAAGWEADTEVIRHSKGSRPIKGHDMAIAEWPTGSNRDDCGFADYALFCGETMVGTIEAKALHKDVPSVIDVQCKDYSSHVREEDLSYVAKRYGKYQVPFTFATNGRPYLEQYKQASGIWFLDLRDPSNSARPLRGWPRPRDLMAILQTDIEAANEKLKNESHDFLQDENGLHLRDYQLKAVEAAGNAVAEGKDHMLIAMATGTGKTRTALGMIYRFLSTGRFRRILFLVDRDSLGTQAEDAFKDDKIVRLQSLDELYEVQGMEKADINPETRLYVATVQSMVRRILYNDESKDQPAVSDFDLVIVDEAHRGYTLDKEMTNEESLYRDQRDYQSKYRAVIDYFDAVKIGLTATPALQTTQIFGPPIYTYTYREAVIDGWLVDHDVPHTIRTRLTQDGIHYRRGETATIYDPTTLELINGAEIEDELDFDVDDFNRRIVDENIDRAILEEITRDIDPEDPDGGKTLIYAVDDAHADMIVGILKDIYSETGVDNDAIMKITGAAGGGSRKRLDEIIRRFKNEKYPSIAVTVDLLTTGIDVPRITTLVFMRRVKSRILFEQMLGRATRLCPEIGKTHYEIYDAVGVYEALEPVITMKPVSANPSTTIAQLIDGLDYVQDDDNVQLQIDRLAAKLQRKIHAMTPNQRKAAEEQAGFNFEDFARGLHDGSPQNAKARAKEQRAILIALDEVHAHHGHGIIISDKDDELVSHTRDYGGGQKPEDYLESFSYYIVSHVNEVDALHLCVTKPSDLTREALRDLKKTLDGAGFNETKLNRAVSQTTNSEMTADIISLVRRYALGSPLVSHEERVRRAVDRLKSAHDFSKQEANWLDRIEKYLINDSVLNAAVFDEDDRFKSNGGFKKINKVFRGELTDIVRELNIYLYDDKGRVA